MDDRADGQGGDDSVLPDEVRARLRAARAASRTGASDGLRAAEQMARLQERIRDFHRNLAALDSAESEVEDLSRRAAANGSTHGHDNGAEPVLSDLRDLPGDLSRTGAADSSAAPPTRRIDALRPENRTPSPEEASAPAAIPQADESAEREALFALAAAQARERAATIHADAERRAEQMREDAAREAELMREDAAREAEQMREDAAREAEQIRESAERDMHHLWQALEGEVEAIQAAISRRVDVLAERMENVGSEAQQIRGRAEQEAAQIRRRAADDAEELLTMAEREAERLIIAAQSEAEAITARAPAGAPAPRLSGRGPAEPGIGHRGETSERSHGERLAEQIREATAVVTRRVARSTDDRPAVQRDPRDPVMPETLKEIIDGLAGAVSLIERSVTGLSDLLSGTLGSDRH